MHRFFNLPSGEFMKAKWLRVLAQDIDEEDYGFVGNDSDWVICGGFQIEIPAINLTIVAAPDCFCVWAGRFTFVRYPWV